MKTASEHTNLYPLSISVFIVFFVSQHMTKSECNYNEKVYVKCLLAYGIAQFLNQWNVLSSPLHIDVFSFKQLL